MLAKTYAALKAAGVSDADAQAAAEELADYDNRLASIEGKLTVLIWAVGSHTARGQHRARRQTTEAHKGGSAQCAKI
jgi:hypothetical protein